MRWVGAGALRGLSGLPGFNILISRLVLRLMNCWLSPAPQFNKEEINTGMIYLV